jgi:hypothetical protein
MGVIKAAIDFIKKHFANAALIAENEKLRSKVKKYESSLVYRNGVYHRDMKEFYCGKCYDESNKLIHVVYVSSYDWKGLDSNNHDAIFTTKSYRCNVCKTSYEVSDYADDL